MNRQYNADLTNQILVPPLVVDQKANHLIDIGRSLDYVIELGLRREWAGKWLMSDYNIVQPRNEPSSNLKIM